MVQKDVIANYSMSQGDLILTSDTKSAFMYRDIEAFLTRGVTSARVDAFVLQFQAAAKLPSDIQLDSQKQTLTAAATTQRTVVEGGMATVMSIVAIKFKPTTSTYKAFGSASLYNDSEGDFYMNTGHLLDWAITQLDVYKEQGLTLKMLTGLGKENEKYRQALKLQRLADSGRHAATQTREIALNAVFDELSALCGIGQGLFKQTDKAKYDDYVIDPTVHSAAPVVPPVV